MNATERATRIRLMAFDIDGVMTDGGLYYTDEGHELKRFNVQDGFALKLAQRAGIELAIITGRSSGVVAARADDLGIKHVFQGVSDKRATLDQLLGQLNIHWPEAAFMGDDLIDLPAMQRCGLAITPANGHALVRERAHAITDARGGDGAVREAIEFVLKAQGRFDALIAPWVDVSETA